MITSLTNCQTQVALHSEGANGSMQDLATPSYLDFITSSQDRNTKLEDRFWEHKNMDFPLYDTYFDQQVNTLTILQSLALYLLPRAQEGPARHLEHLHGARHLPRTSQKHLGSIKTCPRLFTIPTFINR